MATVVTLVAVALALVILVREMTFRRTVAALRLEVGEARVQVKEAEQLASVSQLVSGLAQELKSPLQGVIGNTELMLASPGRLGSTEELQEIQEDASRAAGIVRHLLAFTEASTLSRRWQDINDVVNRAALGCRAELAASGVRVAIDRSDRLPLVYVDGRQIEKVVATLLSRHVARVGGWPDVAAVTLSTSRGGGQEDRVVIEVNDHTAVDPGDEATWSGDLAACRQIVLAHGGTLEVERPREGGCRFALELPLVAPGGEGPIAHQL